MAEQFDGMFTALEAQGRKGDTEIGKISIGSVVVPVTITQEQDPEAQELVQALKDAFQAIGLDGEDFVVTAPDTDYSLEGDIINAHLTVGELVIPRQVFDAVEDLEEGLKEVFTGLEINYNQFLVGHKDNSINPQTGLPEFGFFSKVWKAVTKPIKKVAKVIEKVVVDPVKSFADSVGVLFDKGLGGIDDFAKSIANNPLAQAVVSTINPLAGSAMSVYGKAATGQKIGVGDLASLGLSSVSQLTNYKIDPTTLKAINTGAKIADGADPVTALASAYGADYVAKLGLDTKVKSALTNTFGDQTANFITDKVDINQAAADLVAGKDPYRIVANQFGDDIATYIGGDDPSMQALGYAGVETAVGLGQGLDPQDALIAGAKEYYDRGGQLPDVGQIAGTVGLQDYNFDWNQFLPNIDIEAPELLAQGYDWLKGTGVNINDWIEGRDWGELNLDIGQFADLGGDFSIPSFKGIDIRDFEGRLPELANAGVDLGELDWSGTNIGNLDGLDLSGLDFGDLEGLAKGTTTIASVGVDKELFEGDSDLFATEDPEINRLSQKLLNAKLV
jgi:hypothetical protein